ncbi:hypothetical protein [Cohnella zeiphila]|uniref:Uncharacterized protein n=1 Tax=Cohnella zeiphila TaxID=2761120 RepID=A0A7X0SJC7_9BACL|nr:hypothetical protein [Cohnella zeiphila]MBB6730961.1 hypothetical protein [Cohnella zeiphila]
MGTKAFKATDTHGSARFREAEPGHKHAKLSPDPHILKDVEKNIELARIDGHSIWIYTDGKCISEFKITSLGSTPHSPGEATAYYVFLDKNNNKIASWDAGVLPLNCGDNQVPRRLEGTFDASKYNDIVDVTFPVPGNFVLC